MANIDVKFLDCNDGSYIKVIEDDGVIWINGVHTHGILIEEEFREAPVEFIITLDKSTAIKFAKTLRTEINKIEEV